MHAFHATAYKSITQQTEDNIGQEYIQQYDIILMPCLHFHV